MIKGFIFDLDGVITDTAEQHYVAWKRLSDENGWKFDREVNDRLRGISRLDSIKVILQYNDILLDEKTMGNLATQKNVNYVESLDDVT
ncbi:MAG: HAD hydrolase-like protein, partial [Bacteroidota bacterium]